MNVWAFKKRKTYTALNVNQKIFFHVVTKKEGASMNAKKSITKTIGTLEG